MQSKSGEQCGWMESRGQKSLTLCPAREKGGVFFCGKVVSLLFCVAVVCFCLGYKCCSCFLSLEDPGIACGGQFGHREERARTGDLIWAGKATPIGRGHGAAVGRLREQRTVTEGPWESIFEFSGRTSVFVDWVAVSSWLTQVVSKTCSCHHLDLGWG